MEIGIREFKNRLSEINLIVRDEDGLAVILEFLDGITDIPERAMITGLLRGCEVNSGIPTAGQFFNR